MAPRLFWLDPRTDTCTAVSRVHYYGVYYATRNGSSRDVLAVKNNIALHCLLVVRGSPIIPFRSEDGTIIIWFRVTSAGRTVNAVRRVTTSALSANHILFPCFRYRPPTLHPTCPVKRCWPFVPTSFS